MLSTLIEWHFQKASKTLVQSKAFILSGNQREMIIVATFIEPWLSQCITVVFFFFCRFFCDLAQQEKETITIHVTAPLWNGTILLRLVFDPTLEKRLK